MTPDIEVFVLVYNDGNIATRAIESVLDQRGPNLILTILENGSNDNTRYVVNRYTKDKRVRVITNERNMRSVMGAKYLQTSLTPYLSLLFSDDYYLPNRIQTMLESIGENAAVFSNNLYVNQDGDSVEPPNYIASVVDISLFSIEEHLRKFFLSGNSLHPCSMLIRSEIYRKLGGFPEYLHRLGDMVFFTKLLSSYPVRIISDQLQAITVWSNLRNESANNIKNRSHVTLERDNFLSLYAQDPILSKIERIFGSHLDSIELDGEPERLWFLGNMTLIHGDKVLRDFGFRCLYRAIDLDVSRIDRNLMSCIGMTASEYIAHLSAFYENSYFRHVTFREYARQFEVLRKIYGLYHRLKSPGFLALDRKIIRKK